MNFHQRSFNIMRDHVCEQSELCMAWLAAKRVVSCEIWCQTGLCDFALFLVITDSLMRKTSEDQPRGVVWGLTAWLHDCNFAGDITLLSHTQKDMQDRVDLTAKSIGLKIHPNNTKVIMV